MTFPKISCSSFGNAELKMIYKDSKVEKKFYAIKYTRKGENLRKHFFR